MSVDTQSVISDEQGERSQNNKYSRRNTERQQQIDIDSIISSNKATIRDILNHFNTQQDTSLLQGTLSFCNSKFTSFILGNLSEEYTASKELTLSEGGILVNDRNDTPSNSLGNIVDRVWIEIHHPAIKYFQNAFYQLSKPTKDAHDQGHYSGSNTKRHANKYGKTSNNGGNETGNGNGNLFVEYRKLFEKFVKFISKAHDFYFFILKSILNTYDLSVFIPVKKICSTLKIDLTSVSESKDARLSLLDPGMNHLASTIIYLTHKCVLFIGDLSRYRTLVAKTYLPATSISKEDNNNYSKSIELYKLSLLILPSLGDPYNHIAIIDNLKDDKFNVIYNFIRASLTSSPLTIAYSNLLNLLNKNAKNNSILKKFEQLNSLDRSTITKNDRLSLLKSQFLILFNYHLLPSKWRLKPGFLITGHPIDIIESDFYYLLSILDFHKQIFNDFYFKQLVILTGGFELLIDSKNLNNNSNLTQSTEILSDYLNFIFRYLETFLKICIKICRCNHKDDISMMSTINTNITGDTPPSSASSFSANQKFSMSFSTSLLPVLRLLLCWFKEREIARLYLRENNNVASLLAQLVNASLDYVGNSANIPYLKSIYPMALQGEPLVKALSDKPRRKRLFKEDVALREFKPINYLLTDFEDSHLYHKDAKSVLTLIGELPETLPPSTLDSKTDVNGADMSNNSVNGLSIKINDNLLRLIAVIVLGKQLVIENSDTIKWYEPDPGSDDNVDVAAQEVNIENESNKLGHFVIDEEIDIEITEPKIISCNTKVNDKTKASNNKSKNKKKEKDTSFYNNNSNANGPVRLNENLKGSVPMVYAGSSFSNFGAPPPGSFGKFNKLKKKQNTSKGLKRPQSSSSINSPSNKVHAEPHPNKSSGTTKNVINNEPEGSESHSKYISMVDSIINEDVNDRSFNKDSESIKDQHEQPDSHVSSNHVDVSKSNEFSVSNIGITDDNSRSLQNMDYSQSNSSINEKLSLLSNNDHTGDGNYSNFFSKWNPIENNTSNSSFEGNFRSTSQSQPESRPSTQRESQANVMNQLNQMNLMNNFQGYNFNDVNRYQNVNNFHSMSNIDNYNNVNMGMNYNHYHMNLNNLMNMPLNGSSMNGFENNLHLNQMNNNHDFNQFGNVNNMMMDGLNNMNGMASLQNYNPMMMGFNMPDVSVLKLNDTNRQHPLFEDGTGSSSTGDDAGSNKG
ncbi:unnamed protein product [Pichia kudriavzevii]